METEVRFLKVPRVRNPVLIEGLGGAGHVGKLASEHLVGELGAERFADLYSPHFLHHVIVEKDGALRLPRASFYLARANGKDLIIVSGDGQVTSPEGYYEMVEKILEVAERLGVKRIFALGGYPTGRQVEGKPRVMAIATDRELLEEGKGYHIPGEREVGPILGASGLLLGLGKVRGMKGTCLLGETHGAFVDPRSTQSVLEVLGEMLGIRIDLSVLEERAKEVEKMVDKLKKEFERREALEAPEEKEEPWYIR
ncbi:MAG: proteasome assembly chaperone family protein [Hadesarchaea archaeon]|nr:MAG: proteasome assembly chaperone family protein [Hadesarchaea archaeon]